MEPTAPLDGLDERVSVSRDPDGRVEVRLSGRWLLEAGLPSARPVEAALAGAAPTMIALDARTVERWDSALVTFAHAVAGLAAARGIPVDLAGLPDGARRLVSLALGVPARVQPPAVPDDALTARVGRIALRAWSTAGDALTFLGETSLAAFALLRGRARFRRVDLLRALETTGVGALGIVALINFLMGAVLAFVGAVQLQQFGAAIYVANLVAIAVARELGALMTGIVMAGRTGASYAAVIGTMTVNEEVDALRTTGLPPIEFLVLPRVVAAALMLPALVAYADLMGLLGGMLVGVTLLGLSPVEYARQTGEALELRHVWIGLAKSVAFGLVVALTGCYYGVRCGRSAESVGEATTRAVVMGIVLVVVVDALATVLLYAVEL